MRLINTTVARVVEKVENISGINLNGCFDGIIFEHSVTNGTNSLLSHICAFVKKGCWITVFQFLVSDKDLIVLFAGRFGLAWS